MYKGDVFANYGSELHICVYIHLVLFPEAETCVNSFQPLPCVWCNELITVGKKYPLKKKY